MATDKDEPNKPNSEIEYNLLKQVKVDDYKKVTLFRLNKDNGIISVDVPILSNSYGKYRIDVQVIVVSLLPICYVNSDSHEYRPKTRALRLCQVKSFPTIYASKMQTTMLQFLHSRVRLWRLFMFTKWVLEAVRLVCI